MSESERFKNVPLKWEVFCGMLSGLLVTPNNCIIDRSVVENTNGKVPLWTGLINGYKRMFTSPRTFIKSIEFRWILFVYTLTYTSSNLLDHLKIPGIDQQMSKLSIIFAINTCASLMRDKNLAQAFATIEKRPFPISSYSMFLSRDFVSMASAFTIPAILGNIISKQFGIDEKTSRRITQLSAPPIIQCLLLPLHLLGFDFYNRQNVSFLSRLQLVKKHFFNTYLIVTLRFLPAYGIVGLVNFELRSHLKEKYEQI